MPRFDRLLVATSHPALLEALKEAGAVAAGSVADVERHLAESEPLGLFVAQDLPGLTPELVRRWSQERPGHVAVWLEPDPPPAWQNVGDAAVTWCGELDEEMLAAWVTALGDLSTFEASWHVGGLLGLRGGLGTTTRAVAWSRKLQALRGPGLLVDADWDCPDLTATVAPRLWQRGTATTLASSSPSAVRIRGIWLVPAPPPWEVPPADVAREDVERLVDAHGSWAVVDLGRDPRRPVAARWLARCDHLVVLAGDTDTWRLARLLDLVRELNPQARIGVAASGRAWRHTLPDALMLPVDWPSSTRPGVSTAGPSNPFDHPKGGMPLWARRLSVAFSRSVPKKVGPSPWATWRRRLLGPSKPNTRR